MYQFNLPPDLIKIGHKSNKSELFQAMSKGKSEKRDLFVQPDTGGSNSVFTPSKKWSSPNKVSNPTPRIALFVGWLVRDKISAKFQRTISRQRRELLEIRWCQNDQIFEGFLNFPKKYKNFIFLDFWTFGFLDFFGFLAMFNIYI